MATPLSTAFVRELNKNVNKPNVIVEVSLDSGTEKWGYDSAGMADVKPILKSVSSLQNRIDTKRGVSTRGSITVTIGGRDNFKPIVRDSYLKNRRVVRKDGFISSGFTYLDYAETFTGKILDYSINGDELVLTIGDDLMVSGKTRLPEENFTKTQTLDYRNSNPVDIMTDILSTQLSVGAEFIDTTKFESERDFWLTSWKFDRVLTSPVEADTLLNELQLETNSFIVQDGEKISYKVFSPVAPSESTGKWNDRDNILHNSLSMKSGYGDNFYNRIIVYYDYDESGSDKETNFETAYIAVDASSQSPSEWDESRTKVIKSKWIRSYTYSEPVNITGLVVYNLSTANGSGSGEIFYNYTDNTLSYKAPGASVYGEAVKLNKSGKFTLEDSDKTKSIKVVANISLLPLSDQTDTITITELPGDSYASSLANKLLRRYRNPVATVTFRVDINDGQSSGYFIKPTDLKLLTTDEVCVKGQDRWQEEQVMLTSIRPDFEKGVIQLEAVQTTIGGRKYGFIAAVGHPDYNDAVGVEKKYCYIGDSINRVASGSIDGFYII